MPVHIINKVHHICVERKREFMAEMRERVAREDNPTLRRKGNMILKRLDAKPLEWWWGKKTLDEAIRRVVF